MLLYGKRSVRERIEVNPKSIKKIYLQKEIFQPEIVSLARRNNIHFEIIESRRFFKLARRVQAQGIIAEVDQFQYHNFETLINQNDKNKPTLIFLDRVTDPQNLGAILRACACLGDYGIVLPRNESAQVNETVLKVACGAENYIPVCCVTNLAKAIQAAKEQGYSIGATIVEGGENPHQIKFNFPLGLLFGSEEKGIRPGLIKYVDYKLTLPMPGGQLSFNVAMAVAIFCYEVTSQKKA
jgi:23S rRNA (guanosine2251-2'-O)-methyltransferase